MGFGIPQSDQVGLDCVGIPLREFGRRDSLGVLLDAHHHRITVSMLRKTEVQPVHHGEVVGSGFRGSFLFGSHIRDFLTLSFEHLLDFRKIGRRRT